jgi:hypothetical protein
VTTASFEAGRERSGTTVISPQQCSDRISRHGATAVPCKGVDCAAVLACILLSRSCFTPATASKPLSRHGERFVGSFVGAGTNTCRSSARRSSLRHGVDARSDSGEASSRRRSRTPGRTDAPLPVAVSSALPLFHQPQSLQRRDALGTLLARADEVIE